MTSERQLDEVMVDFWENHFTVFAGKGQTRLFLAQYDRDVIRPHALGKFRDLLGAVAKSPAMLFYPRQLRRAPPTARIRRSRRRTIAGGALRPGFGGIGRVGRRSAAAAAPAGAAARLENATPEEREQFTQALQAAPSAASTRTTRAS